MIRPRWRKLWRDVRTEGGRALLMTIAIAVSVMGIGTVLGAHAILTREVPRNYLGTSPAAVAFEMHEGVEPALLATVRSHPTVARAEAAEIVLARVKVGLDWRPLLLFVVDDFDAMRLNTFERQSGAWPPPDGTMLIERSAAQMLEANEGESLLVKPPHGGARMLSITGVVHDPGLAPAWQEQEGYGYITRATLKSLGETGSLGELRVAFRDQSREAKVVDAQATVLARWLEERGHHVEQARVPPPGRHPHQTQMMGVLYLMLTFSGLSLLLSGVLVASSMSALLARQLREIGVMKALGARSAQIAQMYAVLVAVLGALAVALAIPVGVVGARGLARMSATMLNLEIASAALPWWVFAVECAAGVLVPLLISGWTIARGSRITVREAIDQHGVSAGPVSRRRTRRSTWLRGTALLALRNAFRRKVRLLLTLALLAAGGSMFMTALNVAGGWERIVARVYENRHYDVEVRLNAPAQVADQLRQLEGVSLVEAWRYDRTAFWQPARVDIVRSYPDGSHGSLSIMGIPAATPLVQFPLIAGRWLNAHDTDAVVLTHMALSQKPDTKVGSYVTLSVEGRPARLRVVGIVEEVGSAGIAYVTSEGYARAAGSREPGRLLRIATTATSPAAREQIIRSIEQRLEQSNVSVEAVVPLTVLRTAMGDHVVVLIRMLLAIAALMVVVGMLGLSSAMSSSIIERTREIGVMKTIGATPARIAMLLVAEAGVVGGLSWLFAALLSLPLTRVVGDTVGRLAFRVRLPFVVHAQGVVMWFLLVLVVSALATWLPARRAAKLTVQEALGRV